MVNTSSTVTVLLLLFVIVKLTKYLTKCLWVPTKLKFKVDKEIAIVYNSNVLYLRLFVNDS